MWPWVAGGEPDTGAPFHSAKTLRGPGRGLAVGGPDSGALFRSAKTLDP